MNLEIVNHDEILAVSAILRSAGSKPISRALSKLNYTFTDSKWQMLLECFQQSMTDREPLNSALKRRIVQAGYAPNEHDALLELARIQQDLPPMGIPSIEELEDAIDRLNRSMIVKKATEFLNSYHTQASNFNEMVELVRTLSEDGTGDEYMHTLEDMIVAFENWTPQERISFGFPKLDEHCGGIERGRMTLLAARPGVGKSDLALHMARKNLEAGRNVLVATIEMDAHEVAIRVGMPEGRGESWRSSVINGLRKEHMRPGRLTVYDEPNQSVAKIAARVQPDHDLVIVDYMQIATPRRRNADEYMAVSELSNDFRAAAKRTNAAWLVLSQLSRQARTEKDKPTLADLRGSGSLEQDANGVVFLWIPDGKTDADIQTIEIGIAKNRGGRLGRITAEVHRPTHTWQEA